MLQTCASDDCMRGPQVLWIMEDILLKQQTILCTSQASQLIKQDFGGFRKEPEKKEKSTMIFQKCLLQV